MAWGTAATGALCVAIALIRRDSRNAALGMMLVAGTLVALTSSRPAPRMPRAAAPAAPAASAATEDGSNRSPLARARLNASVSIDRIFGRDAPMAKALLIADQHQIPPEMRDRYARAGIVHMLSISGLHVAIIAGSVVLLLQAMRVPRLPATIASVFITMVYVAVIGAPAPALRSAVMLAMVAASRATQRPTSPWASLAAGAFIPLASPRTVMNLGYQLSVVGIAGLIASGAVTRRILAPRISGWRLHLSRELLTSTVATLLTAPLIAWHFGRISLIAPVANLAAGPVIAILQPTLFLALVTAPVPAVAGFFAAAAHPLMVLFDGLASAAAQVPGASVAVVPTLTTVVAGGAAAASIVAACLCKYPARPMVAAGCCLAVVAWVPVLRIPYRGGVELHMLDVGQGDAILIRSDRGRWILFDAGRVWRSGDAGRSTIIPYVMQRGGSVEAFVLSHPHADHVGGATSVIRGLRPREFWDAGFPQGTGVYEQSLRAAREAGVEWHRVHAGDRIRIDGVSVRFLAPDSAWTSGLADPNEASTIALVEYGLARFLLVGDAEQEEEQWLLDHARAELRADVLKVGHHGSSTSSSDAFLRAVSPALALISVGSSNSYGHPSADVLAALGRVGAQVMRTDQVGTMVVRTNGREVTVEANGERWDVSRD